MKGQITYFSQNGSMGDYTNTQCNAYRAWAKSELENEFPGFNVDVVNDISMSTVLIQINTPESDNELDSFFELENKINDFAHSLWDRHPDSIWNSESGTH